MMGLLINNPQYTGNNTYRIASEISVMGSGIRAEMRINTPSECPIAQLSDATGTSSHSISKSVAPEGGETVTEEFMLDGDVAVDDDAMEEVFTYGSKRVYRFERERGVGCPCECVEQFGCPIVDVHTRDGMLHLVFHAPDMDVLREVIVEMRDRYSGVEVQRLIRSNEENADRNLVFVDRGRLTDRQREVLETAHEMGYFEHPKGANAGEVADALDITTSTFTEHLAAAQRKLLTSILEN